MLKKVTSKPSSPQGIQVIERAASILRLLENERDGLSLGQISQQVGLARSTVQRIVNALAKEHFLIAATPNARVKLGPALLRMAANVNFDFAKFVRPYIEVLSREIQETVDLSMHKGDSIVFVDQIQGKHRLSAVSAVGESFPLHSTANGKAALSLLDDDAVKKILKGGLAIETANTQTDLELLFGEIQQIRDTGIACDEEEHSEGISAVGTAFHDPAGRVFAISIPVPSVRFKRTKNELIGALKRCREEILNSLQG